MSARANFKQIELGFSEDEAVRGAELCLDCYCPANGKCDLQRYGIEYEVFKNRFHGGAAHNYPADFRHDFIMREPNRCINCGRCVRICRLEVGSSCYDNMGRGFDTIVSTADNMPLQMVGCVSCGKCAETCPTGSIVTNPRLLVSYDLDESRCMFCGECVEVCPYDALEQTDFFELAGFSRTALAGESLFVREPRPVDPLRETLTDLVPHVRDSILGRGWAWEPDQGRAGRPRSRRGGGGLMPGGDFHPVLFVIIAAWILVCGIGVVALQEHRPLGRQHGLLLPRRGRRLRAAERRALVAIIQILIYVGRHLGGDPVRHHAHRGPARRLPPVLQPADASSPRRSRVAAAAVVCRVPRQRRASSTVGEVSLNPGLHAISRLLFNALRAALRARLAGAAGGHGRRDPAGAQEEDERR